jgi:hypothetical protein
MHPELHINGDVIPRRVSHKHLWFTLDQCMSCNEHLTMSVILKCNNMLIPAVAHEKTVRSRHLEIIYMSYILPHLEYGAVIFDSAN